MISDTRAATDTPCQTTGPATKTPVEQAIALRDALYAAARLANDLARQFKHQKRQARIVKSTLASLKQLQEAG